MGATVLNSLESQMNSVEIGYHSLLSDYVKRLFDQFDSDGTGEISAQEFPALMAHVGQSDLSSDQLDRILKEVDADGNEKIDFAEFLDWWRSYALRDAFDRYDVDKTGFLE